MSGPFRPPLAVIGRDEARDLLARFAADLLGQGRRVIGVLQHTLRDSQGRKRDMALCDLSSGQTQSFSQRLGQGSQSCTVDEQALCASAGQLATALHQGADLVIFSKFGHLEAEGRGFRQEFALAASLGIPIACTIPPDVVPDWQTFTGGEGLALPPDPHTLWAWWHGPPRGSSC